MKKKISGLIILVLLLVTGCSKNYTAIPYNKFLSTFDDYKEYKVINKSTVDEGIYEKSYEVGNGKISFYYLEFSSSKKAEEYMDLSYNNESFKYKKEKNYIVAKRKISKLYIKAIKVEKIVIIGMGNKYLNRFEINKIFKQMNL